MRRLLGALAIGLLVSMLGPTMWSSGAADELAVAQEMLRSRDFSGAVETLGKLVDEEPVNGDGTIDFLITSAWSFTEGPKAGRVFIVSGAKPKGASR